MKAHSIREADDLKKDLVKRVQPSDGPSLPKDAVFIWVQDKSMIKDQGHWIRGKVMKQDVPTFSVIVPSNIDPCTE
eukprot:1762134-Amphidinium_carterae.2